MSRLIIPPFVGSGTPPKYGKAAYDETALLEPNLLIPGDTPIGSIRIAHNDPALLGYWLFRDSKIPNLVDNVGVFNIGGNAYLEPSNGYVLSRGDDVIKMVPVYLFPSSNYEITLIIKFFITTSDQTDHQLIACSDDGGSRDWTFYKATPSGGSKLIWSPNPGSSNTVESDSALTLQTWHTAVCITDRINSRMFLDGVLQSNTEAVTAITTPAWRYLWVGQRGDSASVLKLDGKIRYLKVFLRGLSDGEVSAELSDPHWRLTLAG